MKSLAIRKLRATLAADRAAYGLWVTLESPSVTEMAVALGLDWVVIDAEHGALDWADIVEHLRATTRSDTVALVRVSDLDRGLIKRALDLGADGVVIPWIETTDQLRRAVSYAHFPPDGGRGLGAERATGWGECLTEHAAEANDHVLVVPMIETVAAAAEVSRMCEVGGVEIFFLGPADYSASAGYRGQWEGPGVANALLGVKDAVRRAGKHCGVVASGPTNLDGAARAGVPRPRARPRRRPVAPLTSRVPDRRRPRPEDPIRLPFGHPAMTPLSRPPESMRPDRPEVMTSPGSGIVMEVVPGVRLEMLVGEHNHARHLMTGTVTLGPSAWVPCHTHTFAESITPLEGRLAVEVEGRRYELDPLDNIVIPRGMPHRPGNALADRPTVVHIALGE